MPYVEKRQADDALKTAGSGRSAARGDDARGDDDYPAHRPTRTLHLPGMAQPTQTGLHSELARVPRATMPEALIPIRVPRVARATTPIETPIGAGRIVNRQPQRLPALPLPGAHAFPASPDGATTASDDTSLERVLTQMASQLVWDVAQQLLDQVLSPEHRKSYEALRDLYRETATIYAGNDGFERKLGSLAHALAIHGAKLPEHGEVSAVRSYLLGAADWLREIASQWEWLTLTIGGVQRESGYLGRLVVITEATGSLLRRPVMSALLGQEVLGRLQRGITPLRTLFAQIAQVHALQSKGGWQWQDYLSLLVAQHDYLPPALHQLLNVAERLARLQGASPYPAEAPVATRLVWLIEALSDPVVLGRATALLGPDTVGYLEHALGIGQLGMQFPVTAGPHAQALWLFELLGRIPGMGHTTGALFQDALGQVLGNDRQSRELFALLLRLADPQASRLSLAMEIGQHVGGPILRRFGPSLAFRVLRDNLLPAWLSDPADLVRRFMSGVRDDEKWTDAAHRLMDTLLGFATDAAVKSLSADPLTLATTQLARTIDTHTSFEESLLYLGTGLRGQREEVRAIYWVYISAMLCWRSYQALRADDLSAGGMALRELAGELRQARVVTEYPVLEKIVDLLPLIPALREMQRSLQQAEGDSWLEWGGSVTRHLANNPSPAMQELGRTLSAQLAQWLAQALSAGLSGLGDAMHGPRVSDAGAAVQAVETVEAPRLTGHSEALMSSLPQEQEPEPAYRSRKLMMSIEDSADGLPTRDADRVTDGATDVEGPARAGQDNADDDEQGPLPWAAYALVNPVQEQWSEDSTERWRRWGLIGAGASASVGALAGIIAILRFCQSRAGANSKAREAHELHELHAAHTSPANWQPLLPGTVAEDPPAGDENANDGSAAHLAPYQTTVTAAPPRPSTGPGYALPVAAFTFGIGLPATILLAIQPGPEIDALDSGDIDAIVRYLPSMGERHKRSPAQDPHPGVPPGASPGRLPITQQQFVEHLVGRIPAKHQSAVTIWLRRQLSEIFSRITTPVTSLVLSIIMDRAINRWFLGHRAISDSSGMVEAMEELSNANLTDLAIHVDDPVVQQHLEQTWVGSSGQRRMQSIGGYLDRLSVGDRLTELEGDDLYSLLAAELNLVLTDQGYRSGYSMQRFTALQKFREDFSRYPDYRRYTNAIGLISEELPELKARYDALAGSVNTTPSSLSPDEAFSQSFNPFLQGPDDFIRNWLSKEMRKAGMGRDYAGDTILVRYKVPSAKPYVYGPAWQTGVQANLADADLGVEHDEHWTLEKLVARKWTRQRKEEAWSAHAFNWPLSYPDDFRKALTGNGLWEDFSRVWKDYPSDDDAVRMRKAIRTLMIGRVAAGGKYNGSYDKAPFDRKVRRIVTSPYAYRVSGLFEFNGYIYSLYNPGCFRAKTKLAANRELQKWVLQGLSFNEQEKIGRNGLRNPVLTRSVTGLVEWHWYRLSFWDCATGGAGEQLFDTMMDKFHQDMDWTVKDDEELAYDIRMERIENAIGILGGVLAPVTGIFSGILLVLASKIPAFLRLRSADTQAERDAEFEAIMTGLVVDIAMGVGPQVAGKVFGKVSTILSKFRTRIRKSAPSESRAPVISLADLEDWSEETIRLMDIAPDLSDRVLDTRMNELMRIVAGPSGERAPRIMQTLKEEAKKLPGMQSILDAPQDKSAMAAQSISVFAKTRNLDPDVVRLMMWADFQETMPASHFAVRVDYEGQPCIIDATLAQFKVTGVNAGDIYVGPEVEWLNHIRRAHPDYMIKRVTGKSTQSMSASILERAAFVPGEIVQESSWYRRLKTSASLGIIARQSFQDGPYYRKHPALGDRVSSNRSGRQFERLLENLGNNQLTPMGLTRDGVRRILKKPDLRTLLEGRGYDDLASQSVSEQLSGLDRLNRDIDARLQTYCQDVEAHPERANRDSLLAIDDLVTLKMDVEIRKLRLKIERSDKDSASLPVTRAIDIRQPGTDPQAQARFQERVRQWASPPEADATPALRKQHEDFMAGYNQEVSEVGLINAGIRDISLVSVAIERFNDLTNSLSMTQRGMLGRWAESELGHQAIARSLKVSAKYVEKLAPQGIATPGVVQVRPAPQTLILTAGGGDTSGQCLELSLAGAVAVSRSREQILFDNLFYAAARKEPRADWIMNSLRKLHFQTSTMFEQPVNGVLTPMPDATITQMVTLISTPGDAHYLVHGGKHAMYLGRKGSHYYFMDPNVAQIEYSDVNTLREALTRSIGKPDVARQYGAQLQPQVTYRMHRIDVEKAAAVEIKDYGKTIDDYSRKLSGSGPANG
ncbi:hypothetical protein [Paraburkholderia aspalathi]|uniref:hypothetical protein n=1 Tax=Paraburkholderia aspalathi TaxID=1324617 RepID=UPI0038B8F71F